MSYHLIVSSRKIVPWKGKVCQYNLTGEAGNLSTICAEKGYFSGGSKQRSVMPAAQLQLPRFAGPRFREPSRLARWLPVVVAATPVRRPPVPQPIPPCHRPPVPQPIPPCRRPSVRSPSRHAIGHRFRSPSRHAVGHRFAAHPAMPSATGSAGHPQGVALLYTAASLLALAVRL